MAVSKKRAEEEKTHRLDLVEARARGSILARFCQQAAQAVTERRKQKSEAQTHVTPWCGGQSGGWEDHGRVARGGECESRELVGSGKFWWVTVMAHGAWVGWRMTHLKSSRAGGEYPCCPAVRRHTAR